MTIVARYPGKCSKCGRPIQAGDQIEWRKGQNAVHAACARESAPRKDPKPAPAKPVATVVEIGTKLGQYDRLVCRVITPAGETLWAQVGLTGFEMYGYTVQATPEQLAEALATRERLLAERKAALTILEADVAEGRIPITLYYQEGEYLSAHSLGMSGDAREIASRLLKAVGAAEYISGWGDRVRDDIVKALGTEFTYPALIQHLQPARDAAAKRKADAEAARQAKFDEARRTGKPVLLRSWSEECNDRNESCDVDNLTEWALPSGKTRINRVHTY